MTSPVRSINIFLHEKKTSYQLLTLEAISVSNSCMGWIALECIDVLLPDVTNIVICLIGTGQLARAVMCSLDSRSRNQIKHILIFSTSSSNEQLVGEMQEHVEIKLIATSDQSPCPDANFLITATGSKGLVVTVDEIGPDTVTLVLGIDELPTEYFDCLINEGSTILVDDIEAMEKCGVDAVVYYYSQKGEKPRIEGKRDNIMNITDFLAHPPACKYGLAAHRMLLMTVRKPSILVEI